MLRLDFIIFGSRPRLSLFLTCHFPRKSYCNIAFFVFEVSQDFTTYTLPAYIFFASSPVITFLYGKYSKAYKELFTVIFLHEQPIKRLTWTFFKNIFWKISKVGTNVAATNKSQQNPPDVRNLINGEGFC